MISAIKGMNDVRPGATEPFLDSAVWAHIFAVASRVLGSYGYHSVWLPVVEDTALFVRGIGFGFVMMPAMAAAYQDLSRDRVPRASTAINIVQRVGGSIGTAAMSTMLASNAAAIMRCAGNATGASQ